MPSSVHVFVPCYKRPDYTKMCLGALSKNTYHFTTKFTFVDDGSGDGTAEILDDYETLRFPGADLVLSPENMGLRYHILQFWQKMLDTNVDFVAKVDNDCLVPAGWITNMLSIFADHPELDILSPDNHPSHVALAVGEDIGKRYRLAKKPIGGLWFMRRRVLDKMPVAKWAKECAGGNTLNGAWQLVVKAKHKGFVMGLTTEVCFQDLGYHAGTHPHHIKSTAHVEYSQEVGRRIEWEASTGPSK